MLRACSYEKFLPRSSENVRELMSAPRSDNECRFGVRASNDGEKFGEVRLILYRERAKVLRLGETRVAVPLDFEVVNIDRQLPGRQPFAAVA